MRKKVLAAATSVALVAVVGIGATLAYFTDSEEQTNVVTMGHVDIDLTETSEEDDAVLTEDGLQFDNVMPGDVVSKVPTITVADDSQDAYIRVKMDISAEEGSGITDEDLAELESRLSNQITEGTGWTYDGEYYYYDKVMTAGESVDFFESVTVPETWANNTADESFSIKLTAEAIQADNMTPERMDGESGMITGWPTDDIQQYEE